MDLKRVAKVLIQIITLGNNSCNIIQKAKLIN
jgi:hypothetical protein